MQFREHLKRELDKLNPAPGALKIKVIDETGRGTNWITLPNVSTAELLTAIAGIKKHH